MIRPAVVIAGSGRVATWPAVVNPAMSTDELLTLVLVNVQLLETKALPV